MAALTEVFFGEWFDSRIYASFTGLPVKLASNELRRLYRMGLLEYRRVKRPVKTRSGKECFRGYMYQYSVSRQGKNYLKYLLNEDEYEFENWLKSSFEVYLFKKLEQYIDAKYDEPWRSRLKEIFKEIFRKRNPRFRRKHEILLKSLEIKEKEIKNDERIRELEKKLEEERKLREKAEEETDQALKERDQAYTILKRMLNLTSKLRECLTHRIQRKIASTLKTIKLGDL